jgi:hypothetical protein
MISRITYSTGYIIIIFQLFFSSEFANSQSLKPFIGIHGGINFSQPVVLGSNQQIVTLLNGDNPETRNYNKFFQNFGYQIGFSFYLKIKEHFSVGFLPEISTYSYGYSSEMVFYNNLGDSALTVENTSKSKINYFNFPVIFQYQKKIQKMSPYVFVGACYGLMRNAQHSVKINAQQENNVDFNESTTDNYSSEYIKSKFNLLGGIGLIREFKLFDLSIDFSYWMGLNNIVNESNRYNTQSVGGTTYDIPDDIKLNHLVINTSIIFPINKPNNKGSLDCVVQKKKR